MEPFGKDQKRKQIWRGTRMPVASHHDHQREKIEDSKQYLPKKNISAFIGKIVECRVAIYMGGGIYEGSRGSLDQGIITFAREK
jgi:hypothetical protein